MNLLEMQAEFRKRTSGLADVLSDNEVNALFNRWFRHQIPEEIGGDLNERTWTFETTVGQGVIPYPVEMIAPRARSVWIDKQRASFQVGAPLENIGPFYLDVETDEAMFVYSDRRWPNTSLGRPLRVLLSGRTMTLDPFPDRGYVISIPARMGPPADLGAGLGLVDGVESDTHAMAVVTSASAEFLSDQEDTEGAARESNWADHYMTLLRRRSHSKPRRRTPVRTY